MKKNELISSVSKLSGISVPTVRSVLDATDSVVRDAVATGGDVFLFGLGKLTTRKRAGTVASNFGRSEPVAIPARVIVLFQPSVGLKQAANRK